MIHVLVSGNSGEKKNVSTGERHFFKSATLTPTNSLINKPLMLEELRGDRSKSLSRRLYKVMKYGSLFLGQRSTKHLMLISFFCFPQCGKIVKFSQKMAAGPVTIP